MSSVRARQVALRESMGTRGLRATNWPLRDDPVVCLAVFAFCALLATACGLLSQSTSMGGMAGAAMLLAFWKLWLPITTEFEPRGVVLTVLRQRRRISWRDIDHLELDERGVFLCTQPQPSHHAVLSNIFLPWGKDRAAITTFCEGYRPLGAIDWSGTSHGSP